NCQLLLALRDPLAGVLAIALLFAGDGVVLERAGVFGRGFLAVPLAGDLEADRVALDRAILNRRFGVALTADINAGQLVPLLLQLQRAVARLTVERRRPLPGSRGVGGNGLADQA